MSRTWRPYKNPVHTSRATDIDQLPSPECFTDLHLDQIVDAVVAGHSDEHLEQFFCAPARGVADVDYRDEVLRDLENDRTREPIEAFVEAYCRALASLHTDLTRTGISSRGLRYVVHCLADHCACTSRNSTTSPTRLVPNSLRPSATCDVGPSWRL